MPLVNLRSVLDVSPPNVAGVPAPSVPDASASRILEVFPPNAADVSAPSVPDALTPNAVDALSGLTYHPAEAEPVRSGGG